MPRVTCRCGQPLEIAAEGPDRIVCPHCAARIRIRRDREPDRAKGGSDDGGDGYLRFDCPCGRRLKVRAENASEAGRCPACGRVASVANAEDMTTIPSRARRPAETPTEELGPEDIAMLESWARRHLARKGERGAGAPGAGAGMAAAPVHSAVRIEAGLRVCPRCGRPVHLGASSCRECGAKVPRRGPATEEP